MLLRVALKKLENHLDLIRKELNEARMLEHSLRLAAGNASDDTSRRLLSEQLRLSEQIKDHIEGRLAWTQATLEKLNRTYRETDSRLSDAVEILKRE